MPDTVGRPMEILLVEDSLVAARITMGALRTGGVQHRITWLTDGNEALDFIFRRGRFGQAPRPDLVLLDLTLPGCDGREVLARIKADADLQSIPVVVMTASTSPDDAEASQHLHVAAFLTKPVDLEKFLSLVKELREYWRHAGVILPGVD